MVASPNARSAERQGSTAGEQARGDAMTQTCRRVLDLRVGGANDALGNALRAFAELRNLEHVPTRRLEILALRESALRRQRGAREQRGWKARRRDRDDD